VSSEIIEQKIYFKEIVRVESVTSNSAPTAVEARPEAILDQPECDTDVESGVPHAPNVSQPPLASRREATRLRIRVHTSGLAGFS